MASNQNLELRNVGAEIEKLLADIGITSRAEFEKIGAKKVYLQLLDSGQPPSDEIRYRLMGAEKDMDWQIVAAKETQKLKSHFTDIDEL